MRTPLVCVVVESPYAGDVERHNRYLDACLRDCLRRGESPYASHRMLLPAVLRDEERHERRLGIDAGFAWAELPGVRRVVYTDCGVSGGMAGAIVHAVRIGQTVEYRRLRGEWANG
jgi:hypothetical protein